MNDLFDNPKEWGARIKRARRSAGCSQEQLADLVGVSKSTVNRWENGGEDGSGRSPQRRRSISAAVAEVLGVPRYELGLSMEPTEVELSAQLAALETKLLSRIGEVQSEQAEMRTRLGRLERKAGGSANG